MGEAVKWMVCDMSVDGGWRAKGFRAVVVIAGSSIERFCDNVF